MVNFIAKLSRLTRFGRNEAGSLSPVLAAVAVPLIMAAGAAVDYGNLVSVHARLQAAVDAAALAAGRESNMSDAELRRIAEDYFKSNFGTPNNSGVPELTLSISGNELSLRAQVEVENYLTKVAGFDSTVIAATSEVSKEATGLEVVLVFDNTGSMASQSRLSTLKVAARDFVEILFGPREVADTLKIGVVPFSQFVNVGPDKANAAWLDRTGANQESRQNFWQGAWHNWQAWQAISNRTWTGCVESRSGNRSVDDGPVINSNDLFVPAFAPDEPGNNSGRVDIVVGGKTNTYYNSYLNDSRTNSLEQRQEHFGKYSGASVTTTSRGPDRGCNIQPIQALTNVKAPVLSTINNMQADGYTHVAEGVGWGLRVISPGEPFTEGVGYDNEDITKAMVLLTDGENTFDSETNHNRSTYTAYGYLQQSRLGSANYVTAVNKQNALLGRACDNVKAKDIVSYTFAYNVPSATQRTLIKNCATSPEKYFDPPSNAALVQNFQQIADELRKLHLSQ